MESSRRATARRSSRAGPSNIFPEIVAESRKTGTAPAKQSKQESARKRIIVCCDGTWNNETFPTPLTNVSLLSRCILPFSVEGIPQVVLYQPGIGTGTSKLGNAVEGATGRGLKQNICEAYSFICHNYAVPDDEIFLIGFSRGAFTVRCIAQFINDVGILTKAGLPFLMELFPRWARQPKTKKGDRYTWEGLRDMLYEKTSGQHFLRRDVSIKACAVWDTVGSLGIPFIGIIPQPGPRRFKFVNSDLCPNIINAFQALSLHERRRHFRPIVWQKSKLAGSQTKTLKQCWFLGYHGDVGGGVDEPILSYIALGWMIRQLQDEPNKCFLSMDLSNLWNFNTFKINLTNIPPDPDETISSVDPSTGEFVSAELNEKILDKAFARLLAGENVENTDPKDDYIELKDPMKDWKFILGGKSYRKPGTRFWRPNGLQKIAKPKTPDERIHFTVRMLLHQKALVPPKSLIGSKIEAPRLVDDVLPAESVAENSAQAPSPRPLWTEKFWRIPEEDRPVKLYEIQEESVTKQETDLLANLLMSEKCLILIEKGPLEIQGDLPKLHGTELGHSRLIKARLESVIDKLLPHLQNEEYLQGAEWSYDDYQRWKDSHRWFKVFWTRKEDKGKELASGNPQP